MRISRGDQKNALTHVLKRLRRAIHIFLKKKLHAKLKLQSWCSIRYVTVLAVNISHFCQSRNKSLGVRLATSRGFTHVTSYGRCVPPSAPWVIIRLVSTRLSHLFTQLVLWFDLFAKRFPIRGCRTDGVECLYTSIYISSLAISPINSSKPFISHGSVAWTPYSTKDVRHFVPLVIDVTKNKWMWAYVFYVYI